jgi:pimeloyl-ACP methyl ester carboxylesterase
MKEIKFTKFNNLKVRYSIEGKGTSIVLLHGFLESLAIFSELTVDLAKHFQVICVDIPGHGKSETNTNNSMDYIADVVNSVLIELQIDKFFIFGHSMGGYATLAFVEKYPEKVVGFGLIHSHPYADPKDKAESRLKEIELIKMGGKEKMYSVNSPKMFADENLIRFKKDVDFAKLLAKQTPDEGIISCIKAMFHRKDLSLFLKNTKLPFLIIQGKKDNYINYETVGKNIQLPENVQNIVLENSGHIGFIEEKELFLDAVKNFINTFVK